MFHLLANLNHDDERWNIEILIHSSISFCECVQIWRWHFTSLISYRPTSCFKSVIEIADILINLFLVGGEEPKSWRLTLKFPVRFSKKNHNRFNWNNTVDQGSLHSIIFATIYSYSSIMSSLVLEREHSLHCFNVKRTSFGCCNV